MQFRGLEFCIILRYDVNEFTKSYGNSEKLLSLSGMDSIELFADSVQLKYSYENFLKNEKVTHLPVPVFKNKLTIKKKVKRVGPLNVGFLGVTRKEKGFEHLPKIIKLFNLQRKRTEQEVNFVIQINKNYPSDLETTVKHLKGMEKKPEPVSRLILVNGPLNQFDYLTTLAGLDIMLMPYISKKYKNSTSGLLFEALENNIPVVCGKKTWAGEIVIDAKKEGMLIGECFSSINEIPCLIEKLILDLDRYKESIFEYLRKHPTHKFPNEIAKKLYEHTHAK